MTFLDEVEKAEDDAVNEISQVSSLARLLKFGYLANSVLTPSGLVRRVTWCDKDSLQSGHIWGLIHEQRESAGEESPTSLF